MAECFETAAMEMEKLYRGFCVVQNLEAAVAYGYDDGLPIRRSQVQCSTLLLFPWARNFTPIAPVCCADGYTTVLLCRVHVECMYYQGTAEKQYVLLY